MDSKTKWHSCRLTVNSDSGRIRWCVGQENSWRKKIKLLVFVPIILLSITLISMYVLYRTETKKIPQDNTGTGILHSIDDEKRENHDGGIMCDTVTSYIPSRDLRFDVRNSENNVRKRRELDYRSRREIEISAILFGKSNNYSNLNNVVLFNTTDSFDYDDLEKPDNWPSWQTSVTESELKQTNVKQNSDHTEFQEDNQNFWKLKHDFKKIRETQAKLMRQYMDESIDPCNDFYEFACGNWYKYNPIPPDKAGFDTFEMLRENLDNVLRDLLVENHEELEPESSDNFLGIYTYENESLTDSHYHSRINTTDDAIMKAKHLYKSCMNEDLIRERGGKPLLNLLVELGGWPVLDTDWNEDQFDWIWLMAQLRLYNNDILISEWIGPDIRQSDLFIIQIDQTSLGLPTRDYFLDPINIKYLEAYRIYMITIISLMGAPILRVTQDVDDMITFETNLADITAKPESRRNVSEIYTKLTVGELHLLVPQIDWFKYLNIVLEREIDPQEPIVSFCTPYLRDLVALIGETPQRTVANYLLWRFVRHRVNNLDERFDIAKQRFYFVLFGREKSPPRWQTCITQVNANMGMAVGSLFVRKYFDEQSKNDTLQMTYEIQNSFRDILLGIQWLDNETKIISGRKIDAMRLRIGYPDFILNSSELAERYKDVAVSHDRYFENTLSILQHLTRIEQSRLNKPVNKSAWNTAPAVVNAYYSRNRNQIMFPAGILQPPFYHRYFPRALNYGGIGVVIGHEITHGFDDKGRLFDEDGNLERWWKDSSIEKFHERIQCLIDQYNSYVVPGINVAIDGSSTQGENIADNGGIKQAYRAYDHWCSVHSDADETLPGLNLTNKQLFFVNFAQVWCGTTRPEATLNKLKTAVHSPGKYRVIGTLSNSKDFAEAFRCPMGSPMNPLNKCSIW